MENTKRSFTIAIAIMAIMAIISFTNLFGRNLSSIAIIPGIGFFSSAIWSKRNLWKEADSILSQ